MANIKTRFAPSPTGAMHLGNVRTALFNWLTAKSKNGSFLIRIENSDLIRSKKEYIKQISEDLRWLGLIWQEGPEIGGKNGPYFQSERQSIYEHYYELLCKKGLAYPCFCSEEQLKRSRQIQRASGKPPRYAGTCRHLDKKEIDEKIKNGLQPTLRFRVDKGSTYFHDLLHGDYEFDHKDIGDFIIRRANGTSPFLFCSAIDDTLMGVTHILRGEDHLTNTPRQIMILEALKLKVPQYVHITLVVGPDGAPLSKRHGSQSVRELKEKGYLPQALLNYLARLGHHYEDDSLMTLKRLAELFQIESLNRSAAHFDLQQLNYWQKESVHHLTLEEAWSWLKEKVKAIVPQNQHEQFLEAILPNIRFPNEALFWANIFFNSDSLKYSEDAQNVLKNLSKEFIPTLREIIKDGQFHIIPPLKEKLALKGKALFEPLRLIFTGESYGPELKQILTLMPEEIKLKRIDEVPC